MRVRVITAAGPRFLEMKVLKVVGIRMLEDEAHQYVVLSELLGARQMAIKIGLSEATSLAATGEGVDLGRPYSPHITAAVIRGLGGELRRVRIDQVRDEVYISTVELDGPLGSVEIDARPSDALSPMGPSRRGTDLPSR
jgi:bifunctional DNase/RNase